MSIAAISAANNIAGTGSAPGGRWRPDSAQTKTVPVISPRNPATSARHQRSRIPSSLPPTTASSTITASMPSELVSTLPEKPFWLATTIS